MYWKRTESSNKKHSTWVCGVTGKRRIFHVGPGNGIVGTLNLKSFLLCAPGSSVELINHFRRSVIQLFWIHVIVPSDLGMKPCLKRGAPERELSHQGETHQSSQQLLSGQGSSVHNVCYNLFVMGRETY